MGKYSTVIDRLPRLLGAAPAYQEKVNAVKQAIAADPDFKLHASWLATEYAGLRAEKNTAEAVVSDVNLRLEAVSQLMTEQFEVEGVTSMKVAGSAISVYMEPYAQVADKEAFRLWCVAQGLERQMSLPWQTTNSLTKARLLEGDPEPDGVTCYAKVRIRMGSE